MTGSTPHEMGGVDLSQLFRGRRLPKNRREDRAEVHDVASRHPQVVRELQAKVVEEAGGRLPFYPG